MGLVPDVIETEDLQLQRVNAQLAQKPTDLERYIYLMNQLDHNETHFYPTIMSDPARFLPIVYDPTIGEACLRAGVHDTALRQASSPSTDGVGSLWIA